jgi:chromate transporter
MTAGPIEMILPHLMTLNPLAVAIAGLAGWLLLWRHWNLIAVLGISAVAGLFALIL